jgi:hypothetical protein
MPNAAALPRCAAILGSRLYLAVCALRQTEYISILRSDSVHGIRFELSDLGMIKAKASDKRNRARSL